MCGGLWSCTQSGADIITMCIRMTCDICDCEEHPNTVCPTCVNCIGNHTTVADYDQIVLTYVDQDGVTQQMDYVDDAEQEVNVEEAVCTRTKPHYRYNGRTGEITLVDAVESSTTGDLTADLIADSFGL